MWKKLTKCIREYKRATVLTLVFIVGEAVAETLIPFITARLVNQIKAGMEMRQLLLTGLILAGLAVVSLCCGGAVKAVSRRSSSGSEGCLER